jgi:hypothetical protein
LEELKGVTWKGKIQNVEDWISSCKCAYFKENHKVGHLYVSGSDLDLGRYPFLIVAMDLFSYDGETFLSILDLYFDYV